MVGRESIRLNTSNSKSLNFRRRTKFAPTVCVINKLVQTPRADNIRSTAFRWFEGGINQPLSLDFVNSAPLKGSRADEHGNFYLGRRDGACPRPLGFTETLYRLRR